MSVEIARLRRECDQLKANIRRQTGEDLASANTDELDNLQKQLESTLGKVRDRKDELLNQQLDESRRKVHILEDHNRRLRQMINEGGHHRSSVEAPLVAAVDMASPATASGAWRRLRIGAKVEDDPKVELLYYRDIKAATVGIGALSLQLRTTTFLAEEEAWKGMEAELDGRLKTCV
nr:MADS-box transcription factor 29-like [Lolium perenne]